MTPKETKKFFNFGNEEFTKKLFLYYSWCVPFGLFVLSCIFLYAKSFVTGFIFLLLTLFLLPINKFTTGLPKTIRALGILGLIALGFLSLYLYV